MQNVIFKGGFLDGVPWQLARERRSYWVYKRTGEVLAGVAVFRWEGEL